MTLDELIASMALNSIVFKRSEIVLSNFALFVFCVLVNFSQ